MHDAFSALIIAHPALTELLALDAVKEPHGKNGAVMNAFHCVRQRCNFQNYLSQFQNYVSSDRREGRVECVAFDPRSRQDDVIYAIRGWKIKGVGRPRGGKCREFGRMTTGMPR